MLRFWIYFEGETDGNGSHVDPKESRLLLGFGLINQKARRPFTAVKRTGGSRLKEET